MSQPAQAGSLTIVGTGIKVAAHVTREARAHIEQAEKLLFLVADPATQYWITRLNPSAESMEHLYATDKERIQTYTEMVERILECVRDGLRVCVAFYGHPGR
jgi:precorrin-3B methylase